MGANLLALVGVALLSSLFTLAVAYYALQKQIKARYDAAVKDAIDRFKAEVGPEIEQRVKQGMLDGVKSLPSREVLLDTTRTFAKTGLDLVGDSLKMATRSRTRKPGTPLDDE
ncbi:MAG TPA: hypothetical protein VM553_13130 [Dongiaceae bacterium]|nr:hypothetical protein [Dongiaceae bacterium]